MFPVGVPTLPDTVAVSVTVWPTVEGLGDVARLIVLVGGGFTVWVTDIPPAL